MPEGDTLVQAANRVRPVLLGRTLRRAEFRHLRGMDRLRPGDVVTSVQSRGKYLEIEVERGFVLRTHLRMTGSWQVYADGARWTRPAHLARVVLGVDGAEAVCFAAPVVEVGRVGDDRLAHLGPDLCEADADLEAVVRRARTLPATTEIAEVLLDQRVAAGIGNVYKSEALWACGIDPFATLGSLDDDQLRVLFATAHRQLLDNLDRPRRETVPGGLAVYGRSRRSCLKCARAVQSAAQGPAGRVTYWCGHCQPPRPVG